LFDGYVLFLPVIGIIVVAIPIVGIRIKPGVIIKIRVIGLIFWPKVYFTALNFEIWLGKIIDFFDHRADHRARHGNLTIFAVNLRVQEALLRNYESSFDLGSSVNPSGACKTLIMV